MTYELPSETYYLMKDIVKTISDGKTMKET